MYRKDLSISLSIYNKNYYVMKICSQHLGLLGTKTISFTETKMVVNPVPHGVLGNKHIQHGGKDVQPPELLNGELIC